MLVSGEDRIVGHRCVGRRPVQVRHDGGRQIEAVLRDDRQRIRTRRGVGDRRAGCDGGRIVAGNVGDQQADDAGVGRRSEPPPEEAPPPALSQALTVQKPYLFQRISHVCLSF